MVVMVMMVVLLLVMVEDQRFAVGIQALEVQLEQRAMEERLRELVPLRGGLLGAQQHDALALIESLSQLGDLRCGKLLELVLVQRQMDSDACLAFEQHLIAIKVVVVAAYA